MLTVRLFGHPRFEDDGQPWVFRAPAKAAALLGYLVTHRSAPVQRDYLASLLWPDDDEEVARTKLRRHFHMLAGALPEDGSPYTINTRHTTMWNVAAGTAVDVIAFEDACAQGDDASASQWYGGEFLESFYDEWILAERERLRNLQLRSLRNSIRKKRSQRNLTAVLSDIARVFAIDPWREDTLRTEMTVRTDLGDRSGALAVFRSFEKRLRDELDADPLPETRAVFERLMRGETLPDEDSTAMPARPAGNTAASLPFSGRDRELNVLIQAWNDAAAGTGSTVLIGGEAGVGKSRLASELALHAEAEGGRVYTGTTSPREARPYEAVIEALREALPVILATVRDPEQLGVLATILPEITARAGAVSPVPLESDAERRRSFDAVVWALGALARNHPLVVILEDLHWAEAASLALIEFVARRISANPILIVGTYREEEVGQAHRLRALRRQLESEGSLSNVALGRLDETAIAAIMSAGGTADDVDLVAAELYRKTEGLPLFLDEAIRDPQGTPSTEGLNVAARIQRLGDDERAMLETAAVAGTGFDVELVREATGWPEAEALRALDGLVSARFLREPRRKTRHDYVFSHHLIHADVYGRIDETQRRRRHAVVARLLTDRAGASLPERSSEIAQHFESARQHQEAAAAYVRAARHADAVFAFEEALDLGERAMACSQSDAVVVNVGLIRINLAWSLSRLDLADDAIATLEHLPQTPEQRFEFEMQRADHAYFLRRFVAHREGYARALETATAVGNRGWMSAALQGLAWAAARLGEYENVDQLFARSLNVLDPTDERAPLRAAMARSGNAFCMLRWREAQTASAELLHAARAAGHRGAEVEALMRLAMAAVDLNRLDEAENFLHEADQLYANISTPRGRVWVVEVTGWLAQRRAQYTRATTLQAQAYEFYSETEQRHSLLRVVVFWALSELCKDDAAAGVRRLQSGWDLVQGNADAWTAQWWLWRAEGAAELGDRAGARKAFDRVIELTAKLSESYLYGYAVCFAILDAMENDERSRARDFAGRLDALPSDILADDDFPHVLPWAKAAYADFSGDPEASRTHWDDAAARYKARIAPMNEDEARAYGAVPWNTRFLRAMPAAD